MSASAIPGLGWTRLPKTFQLGSSTLAVPMSMHRAARQKAASEMTKRGFSSGIMFLYSGDSGCMYDTDAEVLFKPDSWFSYLFGTRESEFYGAVEIPSGKATLFIPKLPEEYKIWCGSIIPPEQFRDIYDVDDVQFIDVMSQWLEEKLQAGAQLHLMSGLNTDSGAMAIPAKVPDSEKFASVVNTDHLHTALSTARVTKSEEEINVMWYCAYVASQAHVAVMRSTKAGQMEFELEATFLYEIYKNGGCRRAAYTSICACGPNAAVLHYGHAAAPNDRQIQINDIALLDMGAEYHNYVSDITCSFPVSGKFTVDQRIIFEGVLNAQRAVLENMNIGTSWVHCHRMAEREILKALQIAGIVRSGVTTNDFDEMVRVELGAVFFPHGLGHLIGCDTHDVGGYLPTSPPREKAAGVKKLRTARILEEGMVLTNEPGCYFIDCLLDAALSNPEQSRFLNPEVLSRFRGFGGVRLEDVVVVTPNGAVNLTTCPRTVEEIESVLAGGEWPPKVDNAPYLRRRWGKFDPDFGAMVDDRRV